MNGAELGKEICDSFKQGCKQAGTDAEITLSVTDLSKTPAIIEALQNMGKVVLKKQKRFFCMRGICQKCHEGRKLWW